MMYDCWRTRGERRREVVGGMARLGSREERMEVRVAA